VKKDGSLTKKFDLFGILIYSILILVGIITLYPLINAVAVSVSTYNEYIKSPFMIIPKSFNLDAYYWIIKHPLILSSYKNTVLVTVGGVIFSLFLVTTYSYPISIKKVKGKGFFMIILIITMLFNGGLIPNFYLINRLGLYDTLLALIIPGSMSAFHAILMVNFFKAVPDELMEAAKIDGASYSKIFYTIMLPLSKPILATIGLFIAVARWNSFFAAIVYTRSNDKWTLQVVLREVLFAYKTILDDAAIDMSSIPSQGMKYAVIIIAIIPIMMVYPFLQKYFVKGVLLGSVKG
jgi:putative aldouronate transport system permease protein